MEKISTIKVTLAETMENLKLLSSYFAGKREDNPTGYDRVALLDSDAAVVALLMEDAALRIAPLFPTGLSRWRYYRSALEFTIGFPLPGNTSGSDAAIPDTDALHATLSQAISREVLRRWLRLTGSDYADALSAPGDELTNALKIYFPAGPSVRASSRRLPPM